jgi:hypothetical protein
MRCNPCVVLLHTYQYTHPDSAHRSVGQLAASVARHRWIVVEAITLDQASVAERWTDTSQGKSQVTTTVEHELTISEFLPEILCGVENWSTLLLRTRTIEFCERHDFSSLISKKSTRSAFSAISLRA